jgi:glutamate formiminotransferase
VCATVSIVLECVINVSEGRDATIMAELGAAAGPCLLDVHQDADHHRAVLTLAGAPAALEDAVRAVARVAVARLDLTNHVGAHPRLGVLDVVPFVDLDEPRRTTAPALAARDRFAAWAGTELALPCFLYGPERTLPELRRTAFVGLSPQTGPTAPHPSAGACAVGARPVLVAYNLWLTEANLTLARQVAAAIRGPAVRALGLALGQHVQVSCNLVDPYVTGPAPVYDAVAARAPVARAELVGLLPADVLAAVPSARHAALDLDAARTIEARLDAARHSGAKTED